MGMRGTRGGTPTKPKHTEESIQQALYWNHPILTKPAFEMVGFIFYAWESDYLAISKAGYVYECEIKISHSDFLNEAAHKQEKMRLLGGEDMTVAKYHSYDKHGIECGKEPMQKPNYFWYVCPEGIISEAECPKFAGLMYITDSGTFRCIKSAPCLHKAKYDTQADLLRRECGISSTMQCGIGFAAIGATSARRKILPRRPLPHTSGHWISKPKKWAI